MSGRTDFSVSMRASRLLAALHLFRPLATAIAIPINFYALLEVAKMTRYIRIFADYAGTRNLTPRNRVFIERSAFLRS
jgi:hypothetical protein